jgi:oxygen-dependent protoporphyrinogen oxidase
MKGKVALLVGLGVGYVLGARAGRERYEQIKGGATSVWQDPAVQHRVEQAQHAAKEKGPEVKDKVVETAKHATHAATAKVKGDDSQGEGDTDDTTSTTGAGQTGPSGSAPPAPPGALG